MSNFRRRLMMIKISEGGLPSGYTRLNYLEKDGNTQYINTGIIPQQEWTYEFDFERIGHFSYLCGSDLAYNKGAFNISISLDYVNEGLRTVNFGTFNTSGILPQINERMIITKTPNKFIIGSKIFNIEIGTVKAKYPLVIFTTNRNGQPQMFKQQYRLYGFSIKNANDELIMNLLPCLDKNGKLVCMTLYQKSHFTTKAQASFYMVKR